LQQLAAHAKFGQFESRVPGDSCHLEARDVNATCALFDGTAWQSTHCPC